MKRCIPVLILLFFYINISAQSPDKISYQALVRNSSNQILSEQSIGMQLSILQGSASGETVYVETQSPTTSANGLVSLEIGSGTTTDDFSLIDWADGPYFIQIEIDPDGGNSYEVIGTSQILSVPYAMHAKTAESISGEISEADPVYTAWDKSTGISITEGQISDLQNYLVAELDPVFAEWDKATGIVITESQISDLQTYLSEETDPAFAGWDKSTGISISEGQINDLQSYLAEEIDPAFTEWDKATGIVILESQISDLQEYITEEIDPIFTTWNKSTGIEITESQVSDFGDYEPSFTKYAAFNKDFGDAAGTVMEGNDARLSDATSTQKGLMTAEYATKLEGIEAAADLTDATNVDAAGALMESDFNAGTLLYATDDNSPEPKTIAETKTILSLDKVENTAVSTWTGSSNITSLGTVSSGTIGTGAELADVTMSLGSDADGDLYYRSGGKLTKLPKGSDSQVLTMDGGVPVWRDVTSDVTTYEVGDFAQGGVVFWVDETGQHGLVCTKNDQGGSNQNWGIGVEGVTYATDIYNGQMNTSLILAAQTSLGSGSSTSSDAIVCYELVISEGGNTYTDWYIPSKEELNLMYENKSTIDATAVANGGTAFGTSCLYYFSSTETSGTEAWIQAFADCGWPGGGKVEGEQFIEVKLFGNMYLRPIRSF